MSSAVGSAFSVIVLFLDGAEVVMVVVVVVVVDTS